MALITLVFLALLMGWATATECAAWGVLGSLAIAWWHGSLTFPAFWASVMGATRVNCMIMLILAGASYMSTSMGYTGIPNALAAWVGSLNLSPYALIAALTVMYVVLGTALDGISMIVLTTAVVIPMVKQAGFDLIWFGIFVVLIVEMAEVSPPVGFNLFVLQTMSGKDSNTVARASLPFFFLLVAAVAIITVFPDIVMVLPRLAFSGLASKPKGDTAMTYRLLTSFALAAAARVRGRRRERANQMESPGRLSGRQSAQRKSRRLCQ